MNEELRTRLLGMWERDRQVRAELAATSELFEGYAPRMQHVHDENAAVLEEIIAQSGFPTISQVGKEGADAAWRIVQHAIAKPEFMRRCLVLLRDAAARGEADPQHVAFLQDRIRTFEGQPQLYGTQFDWDEKGEMSPYPVDNVVRVEQRRAELGMEPLADLVERVRAETKRNGAKPPDFEKRRSEQHAWAMRVGWILK